MLYTLALLRNITASYWQHAVVIEQSVAPFLCKSTFPLQYSYISCCTLGDIVYRIFENYTFLTETKYDALHFFL